VYLPCRYLNAATAVCRDFVIVDAVALGSVSGVVGGPGILDDDWIDACLRLSA
jgi:hypothetical protein